MSICNFSRNIQSNEKLFILLSGVSFLWYISEIIFLSILFVSKLLRVYKNTIADHDRLPGTSQGTRQSRNLLGTITRLSVLNFVSLSISAIAAGSAAMFYSERIWIEFGAHFIVQMDVFTNFVCVILSHGNYDRYYLILCGCCHRRFKACCFRVVGGNNREQEKKLKEVPAMQKVVSATDNVSSKSGYSPDGGNLENVNKSVELHTQRD